MGDLTTTELAILTSPLRTASARWGSRDIAAVTGTSQSMVARVWSRCHAQAHDQVGLPSAIAIKAVWVGGGDAVLSAVVIDASPALSVTDSAVMRSTRRGPLQTMLAAPLASPQSSASPPVLDSGTWALGTADPGEWVASGSSYTQVTPTQWLGLLAPLIQATHRMPAWDLADLQRALIEWALQPTREFVWRAVTLDSTRPMNPPVSANAVVDQVFEQVITRVRAGALTAGDRITESSLAKVLHTTRGQTRDSLRALAATGLLDNRDTRGVLVPTPTRADVFDAYAARRALGAEIIRRAIANPHLDITLIGAALDDVAAAAATGDSYLTGEADLRLQDVLALCSGMRTIPQMMMTLARQLRIYIAVLGLGYVYPISDMVEHDTELVRCLTARDIKGALEVWDRKISATLQFMTSHVGR